MSTWHVLYFYSILFLFYGLCFFLIKFFRSLKVFVHYWREVFGSINDIYAWYDWHYTLYCSVWLKHVIWLGWSEIKDLPLSFVISYRVSITDEFDEVGNGFALNGAIVDLELMKRCIRGTLLFKTHQENFFKSYELHWERSTGPSWGRDWGPGSSRPCGAPAGCLVSSRRSASICASQSAVSPRTVKIN